MLSVSNVNDYFNVHLSQVTLPRIEHQVRCTCHQCNLPARLIGLPRGPGRDVSLNPAKLFPAKSSLALLPTRPETPPLYRFHSGFLVACGEVLQRAVLEHLVVVVSCIPFLTKQSCRHVCLVSFRSDAHVNPLRSVPCHFVTPLIRRRAFSFRRVDFVASLMTFAPPVDSSAA